MEASVKRSQSIVGYSNDRAKNDFYATPAYATEALLEKEVFLGEIWEPACGNGAISEVLASHAHRIKSSDLFDYGYTGACIDFLSTGKDWKTDNIVTNPPFKLAEPFLIKSLEMARFKVCFLLKLAFLEGVKRKSILENSPLKSVYVFSKRLNFGKNGEPGKGSPMIAYAWFVWSHGYSGKPMIEWI